MEIKNKIVIVTGASSGIGEATARLLSQNSAKVALVARSKEKLERLAKEFGNSFAFPADMSKEKEIKEMVKKVKDHFGRIDVLINNAGKGYDAPIEKLNIKTFRKIIDLDLIGPIVAMQQVIPIMRKEGKGLIINISSGTALRVLENMGGYASLKQALAKVSLVARQELKKDKISVSVVYPYITDTDFEKNSVKDAVEEKWNGDDSRKFKLPPADSAEFVAEKILDCIKNEQAEVFAHDWMRM